MVNFYFSKKGAGKWARIVGKLFVRLNHKVLNIFGDFFILSKNISFSQNYISPLHDTNNSNVKNCL